MITATEQLALTVGLTTACAVLNTPRSSVYRARQSKPTAQARPEPVRALSSIERTLVHQTLNSERFADQAPREIYATLLDEGTYLCSTSTLYRVLAEHAELRERRDQLRHPAYTKPELLATRPNQVWSWDITRVLGPTKWTYYYLYVIVDIFSRYVVGWLLAEHESGALAELLIAEACAQQRIARDQLTIHADNGGPMIAKPVTLLMSDLGVTPSHSRPHVSNDNPFSEAQFKTMKYQPDYPARFGSLSEARTWFQKFFPWYNTEHHHGGIGFMTPAAVHYGDAARLFLNRQQTLAAAYAVHPQRFVKGQPFPPALPSAVWINPPKPANAPAAVVGAVDPVGNSEGNGELSTSPQPLSRKGELLSPPDSSIRR
jgi:putative transposase